MDGDLGGDHSASDATTATGTKKCFGDIEGDENDISGSKKGCTKLDEGLTIAMVLPLLQNCKDELASCQASLDKLASRQNELESAKAEVDKWKSAFKNESFIPARKSPEPQFLIDYIETLRSSEKSLKEQLEIAQMKLAIRDLKSQLKPESVKVYNSPKCYHYGPTDADAEADSKQQGSTPTGPSRNVAYLEAVKLDALEKMEFT